MKHFNHPPIVYVAREIWIYDELGKIYDVANFVSKAYLKKAVIQYENDGNAYKEFFVDLKPIKYQKQDNSMFYTQDGNNIKVFHVFKDYVSCRKYVDNLNSYIVSDIYHFPISLYTQRHSIHDNAVQYGKKLEEGFISLEEMNTQPDKPAIDEDVLIK